MCVRSRSCDFYVKLKRTCVTLISLPFVCNNGTEEKIGLKVDITSTETINKSMNIIIGEGFLCDVFAAQPFLTLYRKSYKSDHISCSNIYNCYNQFPSKDKNTPMVSFGRNSSVWFPSQFHIHAFFFIFLEIQLKVIIDSNNGWESTWNFKTSRFNGLWFTLMYSKLY